MELHNESRCKDLKLLEKIYRVSIFIVNIFQTLLELMLSSIDYNLQNSIIFLMTDDKYPKESLGAGQENINKSKVKSSKVMLQIYRQQRRNRCPSFISLLLSSLGHVIFQVTLSWAILTLNTRNRQGNNDSSLNGYESTGSLMTLYVKMFDKLSKFFWKKK